MYSASGATSSHSTEDGPCNTAVKSMRCSRAEGLASKCPSYATRGIISGNWPRPAPYGLILERHRSPVLIVSAIDGATRQHMQCFGGAWAKPACNCQSRLPTRVSSLQSTMGEPIRIKLHQTVSRNSYLRVGTALYYLRCAAAQPASTSTVRLNGHTAHFGLSVRF